MSDVDETVGVFLAMWVCENKIYVSYVRRWFVVELCNNILSGISRIHSDFWPRLKYAGIVVVDGDAQVIFICLTIIRIYWKED